MLVNLRRLVLVHLALGLVFIAVYCLRPGALSRHVDLRGRAPFALSVIGMVLLAWAPFLVSGFYACNTLVDRNPRATIVFACSAIVIALGAACLSINLFGMQNRPSNLVVSLGTTIALIAAARLCAGIWQTEVSGPFD